MTREMADCGLDLVKFKAAVVMGIDLIEVTEETRQIWRNYLAVNITKLAPADQKFGVIICPSTLQSSLLPTNTSMGPSRVRRLTT